jgi:hypothetical protein
LRRRPKFRKIFLRRRRGGGGWDGRPAARIEAFTRDLAELSKEEVQLNRW